LTMSPFSNPDTVVVFQDVAYPVLFITGGSKSHVSKDVAARVLGARVSISSADGASGPGCRKHHDRNPELTKSPITRRGMIRDIAIILSILI
jgi:hypothetical protein